MPKPQYSQKFRDSWLQDPDLKEWLQAVESTTGQVAKCKFCGTILRSHYGDLKTHALSKKHQQNRKVITKQPKLTFKKESTDNKKKDEARVALFTAMHTSIRTVDHLGEVINHSHEKEINKMQMHRTKCTVNKMFESKNTDHTLLCGELTNLIDTLVTKVTLPTHKIDIFTQNIRDYLDQRCYLGFRFEKHIQEMKEKGFPREEEEVLRNRCIQFIVCLIDEIKNRLPENITLMKQISRISVEKALHHNKENLVDIMARFVTSTELIAKIDDQWQQIHLLRWNETKDTKNFWSEVLKFKDAQGVARFQELATFAITLLVLPHSNADVERLFSSMNIIKNKQRNRMKLTLLKSILKNTLRYAVNGKVLQQL
ncbi:unnamed protein product [Parnassius apollo]|uniref:(apollo) hypothetical protein n=1 Tax=Parnassius apollo TaxID=110799 RepID=A0A8S3Y4B4_PARAO|nr:unnamed protein product [Parnassius apollo]